MSCQMTCSACVATLSVTAMSAEPVLGIFSFFASDTYKENEKLMHAAFESRSWKGLQRYVASPVVRRSIDGLTTCCSIYEGTSVDEEDLNRRWLILGWFNHLCCMLSSLIDNP